MQYAQKAVVCTNKLIQESSTETLLLDYDRSVHGSLYRLSWGAAWRRKHEKLEGLTLEAFLHSAWLLPVPWFVAYCIVAHPRCTIVHCQYIACSSNGSTSIVMVILSRSQHWSNWSKDEHLRITYLYNFAGLNIDTYNATAHRQLKSGVNHYYLSTCFTLSESSFIYLYASHL